ncbi:hypothetical protein V2G26_015525 [Clonostachys chloroleuca]
MFPVSPATYLVGGVMSAAIAGANVTCSAAEILQLIPPASLTCGAFLLEFADAAGGLLLNPESTDECRYCPLRTTDQFLSRFEIYINDSWRNFGLLWVYILFNVGCAMGLYWLSGCRRERGLNVRTRRKLSIINLTCSRWVYFCLLDLIIMTFSDEGGKMQNDRPAIALHRGCRYIFTRVG